MMRLRFWLLIPATVGVSGCRQPAQFAGKDPLDATTIKRLDADAPMAAQAYRAAGWPWEAKDMAPEPPIAQAQQGEALIARADKALRGPGVDLPSMAPDSITDWPALAAQIRTINRAIDLAETASGKRFFDTKALYDVNSLFSNLQTDLEAKNLVDMIRLRAEVRAHSGDAPGALSDLACGWRLALALGKQPDVICLQAGLACQNLVLKGYAECAAIWQNDLPRLTKLRADLDGLREDVDLKYALRSTPLNLLSFLRTAYRQGGIQKVWNKNQSTNESSPVVHGGLPYGARELAYADILFRFWASIGGPLKRISSHPMAVSAMFEKERSAYVRQYRLGSDLDFLTPDLAPACKAIARVEANLQVHRAFVSALVQWKKTGRLPKRIEDVPGSWSDPFGKALHLKPVPGGFRIYSVGLNGRDDNGVYDMSQDKDDIALQYPSRGA